MKFMNNIKVAYKLLILVIIAIVAMITVGQGGYSVIELAHNDITNMYSKNLLGIDKLGKSLYDMRSIQMYAGLSMSAETPERRKNCTIVQSNSSRSMTTTGANTNASSRTAPILRFVKQSTKSIRKAPSSMIIC